jgi:outer membrane protein assembly factor BamD
MLPALIIAASTACASAGSQVKPVDAGTLFKQATDELAAHKWAQAARNFERFTLEFPTDTRYQEARFHVGEAHFGAKQYIIAANDFARLASDFPAGPYADDAQFNVCESYHRLSPDIELDQQYTQAAIDQCNILIAYFPSSEFIPKGNAILAEMIDKLAHKMVWTGDYYFRRKVYDSAILYYDLAAKTYPGSAYAPRALLRMIDAYRILGYTTEETQTRERLSRDYPQAVGTLKPDSAGKR